MGHELEMRNGQAQVLLREDAWHRLGTVVGENFTWWDAEEEHLTITYGVEKVPMCNIVTGNYIVEDDEFAMVRDDGVILKCGIGSTAQVYHASEGYALGEEIRMIAGEDYGVDSSLVSLGTLRHGRQWFMTFDQGEFDIAGYQAKDYLTITGSYDGSLALQVMSSPIIVVCANTLALATSAGATHFRTKQTARTDERVQNALGAMRQHASNKSALTAFSNRLADVDVELEDAIRFLEEMFPTENEEVSTKARNANDNAKSTIRRYYRGDGGYVQEQNGFGFVQAVNTYENWDTPVKAKGQSLMQVRALRQTDMLMKGVMPLTSKAASLVLTR